MPGNPMNEERDNGLIRFLLVAFPAGLILIGGLVVASTHLIGDRATRDPNESVRLQAASLNRRPVSEEDLRSYLKTLEEIGERHAEKSDALDTASYWLASTLGGANTGYLMDAQSYEWDGGELRNLSAELPGRRRRSEAVVFGAAYDAYGPRGNGVPAAVAEEGAAAVWLSVARSMAGDSQDRSVRFVAYATGNVGSEAPDGRERYAYRSRARGERISAVLNLLPGSASGAEGESQAVRFVGNEAARFLVERAAGAFRQASGLTADAVFASGTGDEWGGSVPVVEVEIPAAPPVAGGLPDEGESLTGLKAFSLGIEAAVRALASP